MTAYYNEFDPKAAAWLRELISDGLIAHGEVDERSIVDVSASDLKGFSQHHFFAGIGGWSLALRLAGWPDNLPVWTASLPCQPFSAAGKGLGKQDERHLLPHFISLVAQCRPTVLFGEQVSAAIKHGWLDDLYAEMEANNYAVGSIVIGAHSVGAAHIRQRLYWVADNHEQRLQGRSRAERSDQFITGKNGMVNGVVDSKSSGLKASPKECGKQSSEWEANALGSCSGISWMGDTESNDQQRDRQREACDGSQELVGGSSISWIYCRDNKYRPVESGTQPLVDGVPRGMVHSECEVSQEDEVVEIEYDGGLVYGAGINDATYEVQPRVDGKRTMCPFYKKWTNMLRRCYSTSFKLKHPSYLEATVCAEWLTFTNFKTWMEPQDYVNKSLDKDLILPGNKEYGPNTCCFIPESLNNLLLNKSRVNDELPIGVYYDNENGKFRAMCSYNGKRVSLGRFADVDGAAIAYNQFKTKVILEAALEQKDIRIKRGLLMHAETLNVTNTQEARTVRLKGYGNAIVPTLAAEFIKAYRESEV